MTDPAGSASPPAASPGPADPSDPSQVVNLVRQVVREGRF